MVHQAMWYAEWISSVVPVQKNDGRWRVCVDFRDLKRATPKDEYPMPIADVAEPPELSRLKCAGHHHKGKTSSNALQTEQFLVCRVTSRYNHRFSDRTSIPRTKASPEILQPQFYNTGIIMITNQFKPLLQNQL